MVLQAYTARLVFVGTCRCSRRTINFHIIVYCYTVVQHGQADVTDFFAGAVEAPVRCELSEKVTTITVPPLEDQLFKAWIR